MAAEFEKLDAATQRGVHNYMREVLMEIGVELKPLALPVAAAPDPGTQADIERRVNEAVDARIAALLAQANAVPAPAPEPVPAEVSTEGDNS
jgi:hypothetical protein